MTEDQRLLAEGLARFLGEGAPKSWEEIAAMGLTGLLAPPEAGGIGGGARELWIAARAAGVACAAEPLAGAAFLPGLLLEGEAREAHVAGRLRCATAFAAEAGEGQVLRAVPGAEAAALLILVTPSGAVTLALGDCPGAAVPAPALDGTAAADVTLSPALLQTRRALPGGRAAAAEALRLARLARVAETAGAAEEALRLTARYLTERRQFGQPLAAFQALRHRLVDAMIAAQEIHALGLSAAVAVARGAPGAEAVLAAARLKAATAGRRIAQEAVQMHGGVGVTEEYRVSRLFRRLTRLTLEEGGAAAAGRELAAQAPLLV